MIPIAAAISNFLGRVAGSSSLSFAKGFAQSVGSAASKKLSPIVNVAKTKGQTKVLSWIDKAKLATTSTTVSRVVGVGSVASLGYVLYDITDWSQLNSEQQEEVLSAYREISQSQLCSDARMSMVNMLMQDYHLSAKDLEAAFARIVACVCSRNSMLATVRETLGDITAFEFLFASVMIKPNTMWEVYKYLCSNNDYKDRDRIILGTLLSLYASISSPIDASTRSELTNDGLIDLSSGETETIIHDIRSERVTTTCDITSLRIREIRLLERLLGVSGYMNTGRPALVVLLELLQRISPREVERYYELKASLK